MKFKLLICISLINLNAWAQNDKSISEKLNSYMISVRAEQYNPNPDKELLNEKNAEKLLSLLESYYNDSLAKVRLQAYYLTYKTTYKSINNKNRTDAVYRLVNALKDPDAGNVGNVADWLTNFKTIDFTSVSKDSLITVLHNPASNSDKIIKHVAFAGMIDQVDYLQHCLTNKTYKKSKDTWAAHLALARFGVESEIDYCVNQVKNQAVNDDMIYELIPDLIYTRQRKAFDYILTILNSTQKNCCSANPENPQKIECGYRVMEYLAPVIKNFPLEIDSTGELLTNDYVNALKTLRNWFKENEQTYEIITDTY
ncbi:MAG: hypothetical protein RBT49_02695 [Bacteroidales bacterium]|jgi:hypothetical protein|nr:hypothetical protein [Bacteroidales bacterium]